ncbi:MAG TPA: UDP-N-acetylglucosamine 2-epimerase (non-hydrolyzing) [Gammaproteobacteria bacterium]|nr:UDP-N-acetylglucosamine 2-epimerase (non-hydrolyzing) [Gammaproteobacteria bacterium]
MRRFKVACVFGTRPEAIKMAPVILALQGMPERFEVETICTGQHRELLIPLIEWFGLNVTRNMDVMRPNQDLSVLCGRLLTEFWKLFNAEKYDCIIGQGDTTTVFASALAAFHEKIPFAHVEAGLRTFNRNSPFPEEMNRVLVGRLATMHFPPTEASAQNLRNEGISEKFIFMIGNTAIDALQITVNRLIADSATSVQGKKTVFVTAHRRENFGDPLMRICNAVRRIASQSNDISVIFAVHPNPNVRGVVYKSLGGVANVKLVDPMPYQELMQYLRACHVVLTDSGGLQEEAPALNKPVLVLRDETERPELVELGGSILVGSNEELIYDWVMKLLNDDEVYRKMVIGYSPYGDGKASQRLVKHLSDVLENKL